MSCGCSGQEILKQSEIQTPCDCAAAGFCQRHKCNKNGHFHTLCKTRPDYFELWEQGRGPCVDESPAQAAGRIGLGDVVEIVIRVVTMGRLKPWPGCGCKSRKAWLNRIVVWGWWRK